MECRLTDIRLFAAVLHALQLENRKDYSVHLSIADKGLRFRGITQAMDVQVDCFVLADSFREYTLGNQRYSINGAESSTRSASHASEVLEDHLIFSWDSLNVAFTFNLPLLSFIHYVQVFGSGAAMLFTYSPTEGLINLRLSDGDGRSECRLHVLDPDPPPPFPSTDRSRQYDFFSVQVRCAFSFKKTYPALLCSRGVSGMLLPIYLTTAA